MNVYAELRAAHGPTLMCPWCPDDDRFPCPLVQLLAERDALVAGIVAVDGLISDSYGVIGLHLNGDTAPWDSLLVGGYFEDWLRDFSTALARVRSAE